MPSLVCAGGLAREGGEGQNVPSHTTAPAVYGVLQRPLLKGGLLSAEHDPTLFLVNPILPSRFAL